MIAAITGLGIWSDGATSWAEFCALKNTAEPEARALPTAELIPKAERRRAPKTAKLAVEVAVQACTMAGADISNTASVFTSVLADTELSDQICRALALPQKMMSPTKFHNSVQNAAAGYWAIGAGNHAPCTYIGGFRESWALALLEAITQCTVEQRPVLLASYDITNKPPLSDVCNIGSNFACALLLEPVTAAHGQLTLELEVSPGFAGLPTLQNSINSKLFTTNAGAHGIALLEALQRTTATGRSEQQCLPLNAASHLAISLAKTT